MQQNNLQESMDRYDLLNGITKGTNNNWVVSSKKKQLGDRLLKISKKKYELLNGISIFTSAKTNKEEKGNIYGNDCIL
jgi:hypothetical protein